MVLTPWIPPEVRYKPIPSSHHNSQRQTLNFILPDRGEVILYFLITVAFLFLINTGAILNFFSAKFTGNTGLYHQAFLDSIRSMSNYIDQQTGYRWAGFVIWFLVGLFTFCIVWFVRNIIINIRNDFIAEKYLHPEHHSRKTYWQSVISTKAKFMLSVLALVLEVFALTPWLLPKLSRGFFNSVTATSVLHKSPLLALSIAATCVGLYIVTLNLRLIQHYWLVIQKGL